LRPGASSGHAGRRLVDASYGVGLNLLALDPDYWGRKRRISRCASANQQLERRNVARSHGRPRCRGPLVDGSRGLGGKADAVPRALCGFV